MGASGTNEVRSKDGWSLAYVAIAALLFVAIAWQLASPLRLGGPAGDIWQHLAALNAIIERPLDPRNPFVGTDDPSRLFGPYWVIVGMVAKLAGADALQALVAAGIVNMLFWLAAIYLFGCRFFESAKGALCLLLALTIGWIWPPSFTGYHSPLAISTGAAYPAFVLLPLTLILWSVSLRLLETRRGAAAIVLLSAFMTATHPFGSAVGLAGAGLFALLAPDVALATRVRLAVALVVGAALGFAWPYYSIPAVVGSAASPDWTVGANFYTLPWLAQSLIPAIIGVAGLVDRRGAPLLVLLALCSAGFAVGATGHAPAAHRLLPYAVLLLHIGLARLLMIGWGHRRLRAPIVLLGATLLMAQGIWTARILSAIRRDLASHGSLLASARTLTRTIPPDAGIAAYGTASLPWVATGRPVLSMYFPEPLVPDMPRRQADTRMLFDPRVPATTRRQLAARRNVTSLVVDVRTAPADTISMLRSESACADQSGFLIRFCVRDSADRSPR